MMFTVLTPLLPIPVSKKNNKVLSENPYRLSYLLQSDVERGELSRDQLVRTGVAVEGLRVQEQNKGLNSSI